MVEHGEQLGFVGVQPLQQTIETGKAGATTKDVVEPGTQLLTSPWCRAGPIVFQIGIELPDQRTDMLLRLALRFSEGVEFMN